MTPKLASTSPTTEAVETFSGVVNESEESNAGTAAYEFGAVSKAISRLSTPILPIFPLFIMTFRVSSFVRGYPC